MWLVDLLFGLVDLISDAWFAKRYGIGSWLWDIACVACLIATGVLFYYDLPVFGALGILGAVCCFVGGIRRAWGDIRKTRAAEAKLREQENKPTLE